MKIRTLLCLIALSVLALCTASCGGSGGNEKGSVSLMLSDAPAPEYKALYVTIHEVQVHRTDAAEGQWITVLTPDATFNLLELVNGSADPIGVANLAPGTYTQMRLILGHVPDTDTNTLGHAHPYANYLLTATDEVRELKIPSGLTTGIKLVHAFEIESGLTTDLVLDFDAARSVVKAGNSGSWRLKPTIKVIDTIKNATVNGIVTDQTRNTLAGASVSAQVYNASGATETDKVAMVTSTLTDETGGYQMYLEPGTYLIVSHADGYSPACRLLTVNYNMSYSQNFTLNAAGMGAVSLRLIIPSGSPDEAATIEFRQVSPCDADKQIAVRSASYAESATYAVSLPNGTYQVVATYAGLTKTYRDVNPGDTVIINFTTH